MSTGKRCSKCGQYKPLTDFHLDRRRVGGRRSRCKQCRADEQYKLYGVPRSYIDTLIRVQDGKCAACKEPFVTAPNIHHRHECGSVTALLCTGCNRLEGMIRRNPSILRFMLWEGTVINMLKEVRDANR